MIAKLFHLNSRGDLVNGYKRRILDTLCAIVPKIFY